MIDILDLIAFAVFAVLLAAVVVIVVSLGQLPGQIAHQRGHPQAAAITVAGWLGVATAGILWPLALIWAFVKPAVGGLPPSAPPSAPGERPAGKEVASW
jgi:hypothetical protein